MRIRKLARGVAIAALSATTALALAATASAAPDDATAPGGSKEIGATVEIEALGELYMLIEEGSIVLTEEGSDVEVRRFVGDLPAVTVVDTRSDDEVDSAVWYVLGTASAFTAEGLDSIGPENVGWSPALAEGYDGVVEAGGDVFPAIDVDEAPNNVGLEGEELLFVSSDPLVDAVPGEYTASAEVFLHTPATVAGGSYSGTLTLSLFEE